MVRSWVSIERGSHFTLHNLPFGIFSPSSSAKKRCGVRIGDYVLDLACLHAEGYLAALAIPNHTFESPSLNAFFALGRKSITSLRRRLIDLLSADSQELQAHTSLHERLLWKIAQVRLYGPVEVGDYTDFYSSEEHARNLGSLFRDPKNPLLPNWKHIPVGYHGRASSIIPSGESIRRPMGQYKPPTEEKPQFGPTRQLDFELELAFITCKNTPIGTSISTHTAEENIAGMVLFNDWSARDIQAWEYVPLGPFLGKNFASSISPWVVTLDALEPFRVDAPKQDVAVLPYLKQSRAKANINLNLEVHLKTERCSDYTPITRTNARYLYWSMAQQLAHHTVNGCPIRVGDMYASGTISGPELGSYGSMLEIAWRGERPIQLLSGEKRSFVQDGDTVKMTAFADNDQARVGFGELITTVLPSENS